MGPVRRRQVQHLAFARGELLQRIAAAAQQLAHHLGIALLYTGISLANTMVMATSDRVRELAVLRLAGATGWQVLRLMGAEALVVVAVGGLLGALVAGLDLLGVWGALGLLSVWTSIEIPWATLAAALGACAVLAVISAVVPAALSPRRRPVELAGLPE